MNMHAIGDQAKGDAAVAASLCHRTWCPVMEPGHGIEGMGQHPDAGAVGLMGLLSGGGAMAKGHADLQCAQALDHR